MAALGLNLWVTWLCVPGLYLHELQRPHVLFLVAVPLLLLGWGVLRHSAFLLLLGFPAACLLPISAAPRLLTGATHSATRLLLLALGLVAFLFGVSFLLGGAARPPPERSRALASGPPPQRWRRRFRVYRELMILSAVFPLVLLVAVNLAPQNRAYVGELYPGRQSSVFTLLNLGVLALWLGLFAVYFVGVLYPHRSGDKDLVRDLARWSAETKRPSTRRAFTLTALLVLALLGQVLYLRYR